MNLYNDCLQTALIAGGIQSRPKQSSMTVTRHHFDTGACRALALDGPILLGEHLTNGALVFRRAPSWR
jgi:hypothetical protein